MELTVWEDIFFGAVASMGFAAISNPPKKSLKCCGLIAGIGHGCRFLLMEHGWGIVAGSFVASFVIGILAVLLSRRAKCPAECLSFPALLPMIPGMYAYKMVQGLVGCMGAVDYREYFDMFSYNLIITFSVILMMVIGITIPVFLMKKISFTATK
ncbi:MAG: threonine/serine exporter family protein [Bacteroides sp.]|nr:threonine/serine exporter family protein [Bacteroides sp.]MCM1458355.1 threonine/serine exporter family protein [Lachnoclostridium sp.]